mmetsp:Transcript_2378/g.8015  ORF Transcript_2378/g.8015 Transcript_2378/m.8015 type:complete len:249 (-) Transcript_2378:38-784(-)
MTRQVRRVLEVEVVGIEVRQLADAIVEEKEDLDLDVVVVRRRRRDLAAFEEPLHEAAVAISSVVIDRVDVGIPALKSKKPSDPGVYLWMRELLPCDVDRDGVQGELGGDGPLRPVGEEDDGVAPVIEADDQDRPGHRQVVQSGDRLHALPAVSLYLARREGQNVLRFVRTLEAGDQLLNGAAGHPPVRPLEDLLRELRERPGPHLGDCRRPFRRRRRSHERASSSWRPPGLKFSKKKKTVTGGADDDP